MSHELLPALESVRKAAAVQDRNKVFARSISNRSTALISRIWLVCVSGCRFGFSESLLFVVGVGLPRSSIDPVLGPLQPRARYGVFRRVSPSMRMGDVVADLVWNGHILSHPIMCHGRLAPSPVRKAGEPLVQQRACVDDEQKEHLSTKKRWTVTIDARPVINASFSSVPYLSPAKRPCDQQRIRGSRPCRQHLPQSSPCASTKSSRYARNGLSRRTASMRGGTLFGTCLPPYPDQPHLRLESAECSVHAAAARRLRKDDPSPRHLFEALSHYCISMPSLERTIHETK